jgi:hypothetical protein
MSEGVVEMGGRRWRRAALGLGGGTVLLALGLRQFVGEPWWIDLMAQSGMLLGGLGLVSEVVVRASLGTAYRLALGMAAGASILLVVANGAVGIIGSEDNPANLMYVAVIAVGVVGASVVRFGAGGMARVLVGMALVQAAVATIAIVAGMGGSASSTFELVAINGAFVATFAGSAMLFARAGSAAHPDLR